MNACDLLRQQFQSNHRFLEMTMDGVDQAFSERKFPGSTINTVGQIYGHTVVAEDLMIGAARGGTVLKGGDWSEKLGLGAVMPRQDEEWAGKTFDLATMREYAKAVYAATDEFFAGASDADLAREMEGPMGKQSLAQLCAGILLPHGAEHWGEIAALKGVSGMKGLPF